MPPARAFDGLTVLQLKEECRARDLKVSGLKGELLQRLRSHAKAATARASAAARAAARSRAASAAAPAAALAASALPLKEVDDCCKSPTATATVLEVDEEAAHPNAAPEAVATERGPPPLALPVKEVADCCKKPTTEATALEVARIRAAVASRPTPSRMRLPVLTAAMPAPMPTTNLDSIPEAPVAVIAPGATGSISSEEPSSPAPPAAAPSAEPAARADGQEATETAIPSSEPDQASVPPDHIAASMEEEAPAACDLAGSTKEAEANAPSETVAVAPNSEPDQASVHPDQTAASMEVEAPATCDIVGSTKEGEAPAPSEPVAAIMDAGASGSSDISVVTKESAEIAPSSMDVLPVAHASTAIAEAPAALAVAGELGGGASRTTAPRWATRRRQSLSEERPHSPAPMVEEDIMLAVWLAEQNSAGAGTPRSRSPRGHAQPLAHNGGKDSPLRPPAISRRASFSRSRSPAPVLHASPSTSSREAASSKFAGVLARLQAKTEAQARGESPSSPMRWEPRISPLRMKLRSGEPISQSPATASQRRVALPPAASPGSCARLLLTPLSPTPSARERLLKELTEKMQVCLGRLREEGLDDSSREKYQELVASIRKQMDKFTKIGTTPPSASPAARRSLGGGLASSPAMQRFGGC